MVILQVLEKRVLGEDDTISEKKNKYNNTFLKIAWIIKLY